MFKLPIFVDFSACEVSVKRRCLVSGDYNSTELEFSFDKEYEGTKVFEMKSPSGELRMVKTITDNKIVLVGDNGASLFDEAGRYVFEISLYSGDSKLTSSSGFLIVDKEQVVIDGEIVEPYLPVFDELLNSVSEALEETSNLNIEAVKIGKTTTVTFTDKEGNTKEIEIKDGEDLPEYTFGNGLTKVGNNISVNTSTIATVNKATQLANSAYEDALSEIEDEISVREAKDAETLASAKDYTDTKVNAHKSEVNNTVAQLNTRIDGKQDSLVSGTNIKTINGNNILGSGNIEIQGGGSSYTFTDGLTETDGTVSADMGYIVDDLDDNGYASFSSASYKNNEILVGASNSVSTIKASGKKLTDLQDKLTSGTNIKTINGESLLGAGDLTIGGSSNVLVLDYNTVNSRPSEAYTQVTNALTDGKMVFIRDVGEYYKSLYTFQFKDSTDEYIFAVFGMYDRDYIYGVDALALSQDQLTYVDKSFRFQTRITYVGEFSDGETTTRKPDVSFDELYEAVINDMSNVVIIDVVNEMFMITHFYNMSYSVLDAESFDVLFTFTSEWEETDMSTLQVVKKKGKWQIGQSTDWKYSEEVISGGGGSSEQVIFDEQITWGDLETETGFSAIEMHDENGNYMTFESKGIDFETLKSKDIKVELYLSYAPNLVYFQLKGDCLINLSGNPKSIGMGAFSSGGYGILTPYLNECFYIGTADSDGTMGYVMQQMLTSCDHMKITIK